METVYFIVDESGAKGYASNVETEAGEFGVAAGYFVRELRLSRVREDLDAIRAKVAGGHEGKAHVVVLTPDQQRSARQLVFDYLLDRDMYCCYEALYVQGLHAASARTNAIPPPNVKRPPNEHYPKLRPENPRLISKIFCSLLGKAMAYAVDTYGREVTLKVIVDRTDARILDEYRNGVQKLLDVFKPKTIRLHGWNTYSKTPIVHEAELRTTVSEREVMESFSGVEVEIACEDSGLTFAADVLVGSVRHHLMKRVKDVGPGKLNSKDAISGHVLEHQMYGASNRALEQSLLDIMYRHPELPSD